MTSPAREMTEQEMINTCTAPQMAHLIQVLRQTIRNKDKEIERWVDMVSQLQRDSELDPPEPKPEPPKEPDYVICKRCGGSQSVPNPAVSNTAYTTCPKCGGTGYEIKEQKPDNLYLNIKPSNPADWCFDKKNLLVLVDDNFKGIVGENVTLEQVVEIAKLLTEPAPQYKAGDWVRGKSGYDYKITAYPSKLLPDNPNVYDAIPASRMDVPSLCLELSDIESKLAPSEVIVKIGCLEGTIENAKSEGRFFIVHPDGRTNACIMFGMLDAPTRELVESLLKAQEEKC